MNLFVKVMSRGFLGICLSLVLLIGCSPSNEQKSPSAAMRWKEPNGKVKVLATIAMIDDLVKQIGDGYVDSLTLIQNELDPHSYQLVKGDDEKFAYADLIFYNGLGLEHGPSLQRYLHHNLKAVGLGDLLQQKNPEEILRYKKQVDPHIWMDISLWAETVPFIVEALSNRDPVHAEEYHANGKKVQTELEQAHREIRQQMQAVPDHCRYLVTSHDAFNYFTRAYLATNEEIADGSWKKRFAAPEGLAPESQLSATDIQLIIDHLNKYQIHLLFPESNVSKDSIRKIVEAGKEKGLHLRIANVALYGDAMGRPRSDGDSYLKMIRHNANTIAQCMDNE